MAFAPDAMAKEANRHANQGKKAKPAAPNSSVKYSKFDEEVVRRMKGQSGERTTKIIVSLMPGAQLPPQFRRFVKGDPLAIINGVALEVPNGILKQFEKLPEVFRVHYDRPTSGFNYRTSVTVGATTVRSTTAMTARAWASRSSIRALRTGTTISRGRRTRSCFRTAISACAGSSIS